MKLKRKNRLAVLPKTLITAIEGLKLTPTQTYNTIQLCDIIKSKQRQQTLLDEDQVYLSKNYLQKTYKDDHYKKKWLQKVIDSGIIEVDDNYTHYSEKDKTGVCKAYRINANLLVGREIKINYKVLDNDFSNGNSILNPTVSESDCKFPITLLNNDNINSKNKIKSLFLGDMKSLVLNREAMKDLVNEKVDSLSINEFNINEQIKYKQSLLYSFRENGSIKKTERRGSLKQALEFAREKGLDLIQDKNRFIVKGKVEFIEQKRKAIHSSYMDSILRMNKDDFYAKRNSTNNRLDTNITNMCSIIKKKIMEHNNLVSIDLNNSQFAILSYVLQDKLSSPDFNSFKELSASGELYDYLRQKFGLSTRKEAKVGCFELLFSSRKNSSKELRDLKKEFPTVIAWINEFKKTYGDNQFAIMLQMVESNLFIDNLYCILREKIDFCLSIHDSFLVKREDLEFCYNTMKNFFNGIKLECTLEVEDWKEKIDMEIKEENFCSFEEQEMKLRMKKREERKVVVPIVKANVYKEEVIEITPEPVLKPVVELSQTNEVNIYEIEEESIDLMFSEEPVVKKQLTLKEYIQAKIKIIQFCIEDQNKEEFELIYKNSKATKEDFEKELRKQLNS